MPFAIREFQATPNPNALKFVLDAVVSAQPMSFLTATAAEKNPLAKQLFEISGVVGVLLLSNFVTINKSPQAKWPDIKRKVQHVLSLT